MSPSIAHFHGGLPHRRGMTHVVVDMVRPAKISPRPMFVLGELLERWHGVVVASRSD
jgi:hypothetical protein